MAHVLDLLWLRVRHRRCCLGRRCLGCNYEKLHVTLYTLGAPCGHSRPRRPERLFRAPCTCGCPLPSDQPPHVLATTWLQHLLASQSASRAARGCYTPPRHVCAENPRTPRARRPHALLTPPLTYTTLPTPSRYSWPHGPHGPIPPPCPRRTLQAMRRLLHTCCSLDVCRHCTCCWRRCTQVVLLVCCWACRGRCGQRLWCFRQSPLPSTLGARRLHAKRFDYEMLARRLKFNTRMGMFSPQ